MSTVSQKNEKKLASLTYRQAFILDYLSMGKTVGYIAKALGFSVHQARYEIEEIKDKLDVRSWVMAVKLYDDWLSEGDDD